MKKFFKYFLIIFAILCVGVFGVFLQGMFRFDVIIHPVNRYVKENSRVWGTPVNLIPEIFAQDEEFKNVERELTRAGYAQMSADKIWGRYKDRVGENKFAYMRKANMVVCAVELYVFLEVDQNLRLKKADGTQHERGCL